MASNREGKKEAAELLDILKSADEFARVENAERDTLRSFFDNGSYSRISAFMTHSELDRTREGLCCAYGSVSSKPVFAFMQNSVDDNGRVSPSQAKKLYTLYKRALGSGVPIFGVFDSLGGDLSYGSSLLSSYGELASLTSSARGVVPQIAYIKGKCTGILSAVAEMFDFVIITPESKLYFAPNGDGSIPKEAYTYLAENEENAIAYARRLISLLPLNKMDSKYLGESDDDINRPLSSELTEDYSVDELIAELSDGGSFIPTYTHYGEGMVTGFALFDGILTGVVANDRRVNDGRITKDGCEKARRQVLFCDAYGIPLLTLTDTVGFSPDSDGAIMTSAAELMHAYKRSNIGKVTVILGRAYGAGFTVMGSRALGADEVIATRNAFVAVMPPERAVAFSENDRITEDLTREKLSQEWLSLNGSIINATENGDIDDIVDSRYLRAHIASSIGMYSSKSKSAYELI